MIRPVIATVRAATLAALVALPVAAQQTTLETRDPAQKQDPTFSESYRAWLPNPKLGSPLVDHLPLVPGIPSPKDILGYHIGAPKKLTYYADQLRYYRALAAASPRVQIETIGKSDEGRELVVIWISSEANLKALAANRANLARLADPRDLSERQVDDLIKATKPHYHLMGGLHSGETGPSEMLMELAYRLATETSPLISRIRENLYVSITPVADADGRDRNVDWFYQRLELGLKPFEGPRPAPRDSAKADSIRRASLPSVPYWGKYVYHDNNRDINLELVQMRAITDWYFTAHPPIMHDLHEALPLMYTYSGGPPQNPNLDPLLFAELPWFSNWELSQMTKYGMPGVYTHAFMDGWSPGYLGSVAYNHNGLMKMYETQSGRDLDDADDKAKARDRKDAPKAESDSAKTKADSTKAGRDSTAGRRPQGRGAPPSPFGNNLPTGKGGEQDREWYRGIPIGPQDSAQFTRRANTNYMETGVLSSLQLASMFPATVLENFYVKTRNSIRDGKTTAPFGYVIPVQRDMTRVAEMVRILRRQHLEIGQATKAFKVDTVTYPAGSYVIKRDQPYGRLAKNLLEKQDYPDDRLNTYDDSGWTMGLAMNVDVVAVKDSSILEVPTRAVTMPTVTGTIVGNGSAGMAVAHLGSNNMVTFRYRLKSVPMKIAERSFKAEDREFPAGSFLVTDPAAMAQARAAVQELGLTAAALSSLPSVPTHDADVPRVAIYSEWDGTQNLGWYRLTFDEFGIPYDLFYKEQLVRGGLRDKYDVILVAEQDLSKRAVMQKPNVKPVPYRKSAKYQFLGMYGESADITGGFGQPGVDAFAEFLDQGGTLIAVGEAARLPIEFGWAGTVEKTAIPGLRAQRPLVEGEIVRPENPVFYGYEGKKLPIKYVGGQPFRVGIANQDNVLARYVGGESAVLSGLMVGADSLKNRPFAVDLPEAYHGHGRVILFSNNPIYRWQNHGEFNMIFNSLLNWNDVVVPARE